ncbi:gas vesicle protein GvpO [Streptomyces sp. NBC_01803]|uniref:gas vesicle protein GvpO n=1 Tax=Streptomyces sp. NBC_01803 TaxID=2975946 RepID=UPI002DD9F06C|nr:gas vesicle protein [Streptomyces sp. NBC_01803]WSA44164.1 gas vesicle protein [Streptomyces sp. NBC_01803]
MADHPDRRRSGPDRNAPVRGPVGAARRASRRLEKLTGHPVDGVSAVCREEDGWRVDVDVLEVPRIPDTTSLLATYQVELDSEGRLLNYRRVRRYRRSATDDC